MESIIYGLEFYMNWGIGLYLKVQLTGLQHTHQSCLHWLLRAISDFYRVESSFER